MCKKWLRVLPFYSTENMVKFPWGKNQVEQQHCTKVGMHTYQMWMSRKPRQPVQSLVLFLFEKLDYYLKDTLNPVNTTIVYSSVNSTTGFGLISHHQVDQRYKCMYIIIRKMFLE